jgi:hypothetical protein
MVCRFGVRAADGELGDDRVRVVGPAKAGKSPAISRSARVFDSREEVPAGMVDIDDEGGS